jgi:fatty-acid desaturase
MNLARASKGLFENYLNSLKALNKLELLDASFVFYIFVTFSEIEILSKFSLLSYEICRFTFIVTIISIVLFYIRLLKASDLSKCRAIEITRFTKIIVLFNFFILVDNLICRPNNWDSMTYHLPRIEHWLNDGNLSFYSTTISRQNWSPPFGDFLSLVPHSIFHNDYFDSIFSFVSLIILEISVSLILNRLTTHRSLKVSLFFF